MCRLHSGLTLPTGLSVLGWFLVIVEIILFFIFTVLGYELCLFLFVSVFVLLSYDLPQTHSPKPLTPH